MSGNACALGCNSPNLMDMTSPPTPPSSSEQLFLGLEVGTWPAWASVLVATIAALVALSTYRRGLREKIEQQARLVYGSREMSLPVAKGDPVSEEHRMAFLDSSTLINHAENPYVYAARACPMLISLHNRSEELVLRWTATLTPEDDRGLPDLAGASYIAVTPMSSDYISFIGSDRFFGNSFFTIFFMDSSGRYWRRDEGRPVERIAPWQLEPPGYWSEAQGRYAKARRALRRRRVMMRRALRRRRRSSGTSD